MACAFAVFPGRPDRRELEVLNKAEKGDVVVVPGAAKIKSFQHPFAHLCHNGIGSKTDRSGNTAHRINMTSVRSYAQQLKGKLDTSAKSLVDATNYIKQLEAALQAHDLPLLKRDITASLGLDEDDNDDDLQEDYEEYQIEEEIDAFYDHDNGSIVSADEENTA